MRLDEWVYSPPQPKPNIFSQTLGDLFLYTSNLVNGNKPPSPTIGPVGGGIRGDASQYLNPSIYSLDPATLLETASPITLYTAVAVPKTAFTFGFDYFFRQSAGSLTVALGGVPIVVRQATNDAPGLIRRVSMVGTNPAVLNLGLAELTFTFDGPPGLEMVLDNIVFPGLLNGDFSDLDGNWFSRGDGQATLTALVRPVRSEFTTLSVAATSSNIVVSWPASAQNYVLESTGSGGSSTNWTAVTNQVQVTPAAFQVSVSVFKSQLALSPAAEMPLIRVTDRICFSEPLRG